MEYSICFDIGGTRIKAGVLLGHELLHTEIIAIQDHSRIGSILSVVEEKIIQLVNEIDGTLIAIGMALPSLIDSDLNRILSKYVKYTDASEIDLNQWAESKFGVPIFLENDARAALMGEAFHGVGKGFSDVALVTFGTGIGSAVMLNGQLLKGKDYLAGNLIGHSVIDYDGSNCNCGGEGCLESVASSWALPQQILETNIPTDETDKCIDYKYIFEAYKSGDTHFVNILNNSLNAWGKAMINLVLAYNPECIICAGGIMNEDDMLLDSFRRTLDSHGWISSENVQLIKAENTDFAALFGLSEIISQKKNGEK